MDWFVLIMLLGITAYLYVNLFVFPATPFLLSDDQVYFWMHAQRMLYGEWPYRDFFQFTPPGADLFYFGLFKLFGPRIWISNLVVLALGVALCWVCFSIAIQVMERRLALLATLLFLTLIYTTLLNATHHWFSVWSVMCATAVAMRGNSTYRIVTAGALLGVASFMTQSHGAAAMLALTTLLMLEGYRSDKPWRNLGRYPGMLWAAFAIALISLGAYFVATVGLKRLWYFQVAYVLRYVVHGPETKFLGMPELATWRSLPLLAECLLVYTLLPVIYPFVLKRCWRERLDAAFPTRQIVLLSLVGLFLLAEVAFSLSWLRVYAVSMPGIVLLVWLIGRTDKIRRHAVGLFWVGVVGIALLQTWHRHHHNSVATELPGGKAATTPEACEKLGWVMRHTSPGQFFFQAGWPGMYLPLQLRNPVFLDAVGTSDATRPQYVERAIQQLETKGVRYVLWSPRLDYPDDLHHPSGDHLTPLRAYLRNRYHRVRIFSDQDEVWERK